MSAKRQTGRPAWRDSSSRKVSVVEAASIVESFLIEQNLVRTLAELRGEAASLLFKGKRGQVKSLNKILHDYVVLIEERDKLKQTNSTLEQALKAEKMVNAQGHDNMRMLCRRIHESVAQYEGGPIPPLGNLLPPLGNPLPQMQPMPPFFFGHCTPPAAGIGPMLANTPVAGISPALASTPGAGLPALGNTPGAGILPALANTPGAGILPGVANTIKAGILPAVANTSEAGNLRASESTPGTEKLPAAANAPGPVTSQVSAEQSNKRTIHSLPSNSGPTVAASKKARQSITSAEKSPPDASASPPWAMCGAVRKTSLNSVRTVPSKPSTIPVARSSRKGSKKQQKQQMPPTLSHSIPPPQHPLPPITSSSPLVKVKSLPSGPTTSASACIDLSSPAKASDSKTASSSDSKALLPNSAPPTSEKLLAPPQRQLSEDSHRRREEEGSTMEVANCAEIEKELPIQVTGECQQDRTSPDSRRCGSGARGMKPSKTMRPLNFSSGEKNPDDATQPVASTAADAPSPSPSSAGVPALDPGTPNDTDSRNSSLSGSQETVSPDASSMSVLGHDLFLEDDEQLCGDLAPIDDILAILNETSFSDIYSHSLTAGDCGQIHADQTGSQIGDDSFGFHGLLSKINPQQPDSGEDESGNVLTPINVNIVNDGALERKLSSPMSKRVTAGAAVQVEMSRSTTDKENIHVCAAWSSHSM